MKMDPPASSPENRDAVASRTPKANGKYRGVLQMQRDPPTPPTNLSTPSPDPFASEGSEELEGFEAFPSPGPAPFVKLFMDTIRSLWVTIYNVVLMILILSKCIFQVMDGIASRIVEFGSKITSDKDDSNDSVDVPSNDDSAGDVTGPVGRHGADAAGGTLACEEEEEDEKGDEDEEEEPGDLPVFSQTKPRKRRSSRRRTM